MRKRSRMPIVGMFKQARKTLASISSHNDLQLLRECETKAKQACRNAAQICEMVLRAERETNAIGLRDLESLAGSLTEIRDTAILFRRLRETMTQDTGNTTLNRTMEPDSQIAQITEALAAVEDRISNITQSQRNQTTN